MWPSIVIHCYPLSSIVIHCYPLLLGRQCGHPGTFLVRIPMDSWFCRWIPTCCRITGRELIQIIKNAQI